VLPDSGVHRYFAHIKRKIKLNSGVILIAVPLSILAKSSEKIAEFNFERFLKEKHAKTDEFTRKLGICFNC
jgi:Skp family chaperone for outer membrane proteins